MSNRKPLLNRFYTWLLVLLPVLSMYQIGPLDLDLVLIAVFSLLYLLCNRYVYTTVLNRKMLLIILYIALVSLVNILLGRKYALVSDIILRTGKYCLYLFVVFFFGNEATGYEDIMKSYRVVAFAATVYLVVQAVAFYGAGITLPSKIGGDMGDVAQEVGRLRSFYSEPAAMSYSLVPFVACSLFGQAYHPKKDRGTFDAVVVSAAILLSTSGQGIIVTAIIWLAWIILRIKNRQFKRKDALLLLALCVAVVVLYKTGILEFALERAGNTEEGGTVSARASGYKTLAILTPMQRIFGSGYGNHVVEGVLETGYLFDTVNYSTIAQFLFSLGVVGTFIWVVFFVGLFRKGSVCVRVLILALVVLSVGGCPTLPIVFPIWLTLMCVQLPKGQFSRRKQILKPEQS